MDMIKKFNAVERKIRHARYNCYEIRRDDLLAIDETDTTAEAEVDNAPQADANHEKSTQTEGESAEQENDKSTQTEGESAEQENAPKRKRQKLCRKCSAKLNDEQADAEKRAIHRATHLAHLQRISVVNFVRFMD